MTLSFQDDIRLRDVRRLDPVNQGNFVMGLVTLALAGQEIATGGLAFAAAFLVLGLVNLWVVDRKLREVSP
ncbi:hypothetical protein [Halobacterium litoreum]|uniref:Uncharacterized protein n=1 Tax=Halobacterium litoreum TaxID=2039234 RepID=A0ABD5NAN1_9EURY|nr:hypothetical protein [Halobacterium litoreum]UHH14826.1 hypothetical protein LT972_07425 [Halobacterium litoreum]